MSSWNPPQPQEDVLNFRSLGIVGGGPMGRSIAEKVASSGIDVVLVEVSAARAAEAREELRSELDHELARWGITVSEKAAILGRVRFTSELRDLADLDLVIEAVSEELALKERVLRELHTVCSQACTFITNTSTLSVTELAAGSGRPDRVVGMHFLYPVTRSPIVELVRGAETSDSTFAVALALARVLDKEVVEVFDSPGYVATRAMMPFLNEAMHLVLEGVATAEDVDRAIRLGYEFRMGPLEYADRVGLDKVQAWMDHLCREIGELRFRPCPLLRQLVRAGYHGRKSGRGFYRWVNGERGASAPARSAP